MALEAAAEHAPHPQLAAARRRRQRAAPHVQPLHPFACATVWVLQGPMSAWVLRRRCGCYGVGADVAGVYVDSTDLAIDRCVGRRHGCYGRMYLYG